MARKSNTPSTNAASPKAPHFLAWHITEKGDKSFWNRIGAAWQHKDGGGFTVQLEVLPLPIRHMHAAVQPNRTRNDCEEKLDPDERPDPKRRKQNDEMNLTQTPD